MKTLYLTIVLLAFAVALHGQEQTPSEVFESLQVNSSPAYVILGVEPENIQRPNSPSEFVANVQSATVNNMLATNFAMEATPYYWGKKQPDSRKFDPLDYATKTDWLTNVLKSATLSFATSPSDDFTFGTIEPGTGLGAGFHVLLATGGLSPKVKENLIKWLYSARAKVLFDGLINTLEDGSSVTNIDEWVEVKLNNESSLKNAADEIKESVKDRFIKELGKTSVSPADTTEVRNARKRVEAASTTALGKVNAFKFPLAREGFMLEVSAANAYVVSNGVWDERTKAKNAWWITPSYRFSVGENPEVINILDIMAVARLTFNNDAVDSADYVDLGGKVQFIHENISFAWEGVYRYLTEKPEGVDKKYTYRTAGTFSYKLSDLVTFKTTFGRNFNGNSTVYDTPQTVFIMGGFNFGFSKIGKK